MKRVVQFDANELGRRDASTQEGLGKNAGSRSQLKNIVSLL
jgi:hypothetical protein